MPEKPTYEALEKRVKELEQAASERKCSEDALMKSEDLCRTLLALAPSGIYLCDTKGNCQYANPRWCEMAGLSLKESLGDGWAKGLHPEDRDFVLLNWQQMVESEGKWGLEYRFQTPAGKTTWVYGLAVPQRDAMGNIIAYIGINTDITERKKAEADLTAAYQNLEILWGVASMADADVKTISDHILASITRMSDSPYGFFGFVNEDESVMTIHTWSGEAMKDCAMADKPQQYPVCKAGIWAEAIRRREPLVLNDYNAALTGKKGLPEGHVPLTNLLVLPILVNGRITAVAAVANKINGYRQQDANQITAFLGSIQSIVERKRAEEALRESEERLRTILQTALDGFWILDTRGRILEVNETYCQMSGYSEQELLTLCISDLEVIESAESTAARIQKIIASGEDCFESRHRSKYGSIFDVEVSVQYRPTEGGRFVCFLRNITERKLAEEALIESENKFRLTFNFSPDSVNINRLHDGLYVDINEGFTQLTGFTRDDVIGRTSLEIGIWSDSSDRQKLVRGLREHGIYENLEARFRCKDGKLVTALMSARVISLKGVPHIISITRDITEIKLIQAQLQQAQKIESIGSLAGGIAHDLNNILFPISGLSEMLLDDIPSDNPAYESIEQIHKSAQRGSDLVKQILSFSRQSNPQKLPIRIQPILKEVLKLVRAAIPMNIGTTSHIKPDCGMVFADPTQVHQIAMNLITNAYHAVEGKGGSIHIDLKAVEFGKDELPFHTIQSGRYACITVSDTGTGIDPALIDKIFDPYFTTKEIGKGTGLGLSVVHGIVKEHGGDIRVDSEVGKGTAFHVYLPLLEDSRNSRTATVTGKYPTGSESILLVDDEEPIIRLEQMMLERLGYQVTPRTSSPDALDAFRANPSIFDLVISDRGMPNMTGEQLARELISIRPEIPVILCTGFSDENDEKRARDLGVKGFLKKPVAAGDLATLVRKVLDESKDSTFIDYPRDSHGGGFQ
jgi:PAS domain S-box-containing protein